jgi:cyclophilin family peptidyl-prolyl cis-trans isomerase
MVHRVIPGFIIQAGDFVFGNGSAGESVFGKKFKDERNGLLQKHNQRGVLSMGNAGKNSNTSQFFLTFQAAPQCDGKHVVFGRVVSGWQVVDAVEAVGTTGGEPSVPIEITDCGIFTPLSTPGAGYWYDQPNGESYTGTSPVFMVRPRVAVVAPNVSVGDKFVKAVGDYCSVVTVLQANQDETAILNQVSDLLKSFAVDVVLVAPACRDLVPNIKLNPLWNSHASSEGFPVGQVVMEAKPVEALSTIRTQSWLAKITPWQLDGTIQ